MDIIRKIQKEKYEQFLKAEEAKQKQLENNKQEILNKLCEENEKIKYEEKHQVEIVLCLLEKNIQDIIIYKNIDIARLDMLISNFTTILSEHNILLIQYKLETVQELVSKFVSTVTDKKIQFNITELSTYEKRVISMLSTKLESILTLAKMNTDLIGIQIMDTSNDEKLARELAEEFGTLYM
jgi:hypothetical protein